MIMLICFENSFCIHISIYVNRTKSEGHIVVFDCDLTWFITKYIEWLYTLYNQGFHGYQGKLELYSQGSMIMGVLTIIKNSGLEMHSKMFP
jgi:hypothetical protein